MWTREDDVHNGRFRPISAHYLKAGFDPSGKLTAWHHRIAVDRVGPYMDPVRETFIDEIALKRGIDPLKFRLELLKNTPRAMKVVERVAEMANWGKKRDGRGLGVAFIDYSGSQLAGIAEVSVDRANGQIRVHDFWCTIDCGVAVQPDNVVAQTESSIVYGLGMSLSERISVKNGVVEQSNFYDYRVPRMNEVPAMHIEVIATDNHPTGAGQMATPLIAPAISNAVMQLSGVRLRHTPFTPERVKAALG
jgi:isoquinoline 1-oxidoreductase beta subunit